MNTHTRLLAAFVYGAIFTQSAFALVSVAAGEGCSIYLPSQPKAGGEYKWVGKCIDGLVVGEGILQFHWRGSLYSESTGNSIRGYRTGLWILTEGNKTFEYAMLMKDGVADSIAVREFPKGERVRAFSRAEAIVELEKYAIRSEQGGATPVAATSLPARLGPGQTAKGTLSHAALNCTPSIQVIDGQYTNTYTYIGNGVVSFSNNFGLNFEKWNSIEGALNNFTVAEQYAIAKARTPTSCTGLDPFGRPAPCPKVYPPADYAGAIEWAQCHLKVHNFSAEKGTLGGAGMQNSRSSSEDDIDIVTPSVPGCPKYLRKSLVEWRRNGGNPEGTSYIVHNVSQRILKVTFRENGQNTDTETLNPNSEDIVSIANGRVPPYVVRDFKELFEFNRSNSASKDQMVKSLQCSLAIQPR